MLFKPGSMDTFQREHVRGTQIFDYLGSYKSVSGMKVSSKD